jgi:hypothetical protein
MRGRAMGYWAAIGVAGVLALTSIAAAQTADEPYHVPKTKTLFDKLIAESKPSAPAPNAI